MKYLTGLFLCCISLILCAQITLAEKGVTEYVIVTAPDASAGEQNAAAELQAYLKKATGADFKIVNQGINNSDVAIFVGNTEFAAKHGIVQSAFEPEEWCIRTVGRNIVIAGGRPRGVFYGVCEFLERFAGCRWLSINMELVPRVPELKIPPEVRIQAKPAFRARSIYFLVRNMPEKEFHYYTNHLRLNAYGNKPEYGWSERYGSPGGAHTYVKYSKDFPVGISWMGKDGKRVRVLKKNEGQICYSSREVRKRFADKMKVYIKKDRENAARMGAPYPVFYDMSANDCSVPCYCKECLRLSEKYGISGMVIDFTNAVAEEVEKEYPDVLIMMFAYKESMALPKNITARGNVVVRLAFMDVEFAGGRNRDVMRPLNHPQNRWYAGQMDAWRKVAAHLAVWDYWKLYYEQYPAPKTLISNLPDYLRRYRDLGVIHLFAEAEIASAMEIQPDSFIDLRNYAGAKLMVDPDLDMRNLIDDFMSGFYGKAAVPMKEYLAYLENRMKEEPLPLGYTHPARRKFMDRDFFLASNSLLTQAEKLASGEALPLANIGQERLILDLAYLNMMPDRFPDNPLKITKEQLAARIRKNLDTFGRKYFTEKAWRKIKAENFQRYLAPFHRPPLPDEFKGRTVIDMVWSDLGSGTVVEDADAAGGKARSVPQKYYSGKAPFHGRDIEFGIYARDTKKHLLKKVIAKIQIPQDEKYHFYYLGRTGIPENSCLWLHWTWWLQIPLAGVYDPMNTDTRYDIWLSLKAQGPSYVKGSRLPDDLRVDRAIFAKVMDRAEK